MSDSALQSAPSCNGNDVTLNKENSKENLEQTSLVTSAPDDVTMDDVTHLPSTNDAISGLEWNDGIGILPGTNMKFRVNETGDVDMMSDPEEAPDAVNDDVTDSVNDDVADVVNDDVTDVVNDDITDLVNDDVTDLVNDDVKQTVDTSAEKNDCKENIVACDDVKELTDVTDNDVSMEQCSEDSKKETVNAIEEANEKKGAPSIDDSQREVESEIKESRPTIHKIRRARSPATIASCMFCQKSGDIRKFCGRFCSKQCVARNAAKHKQNAAKNAITLRKLERKRVRSSDYCDAMSLSVDNEPGNMKIKLRRNLSILDADEDYDPTSSKRRHTTSQRSRINFDWQDYLKTEEATAAPIEVFRKLTKRDPIPEKANKFKVGWLLEAVDPSHQTMVCQVSVASILGHRLKLHFEGFPLIYDFWADADSPFIFPCGFCEKTSRRLSPPCGYEEDQFSWRSYADEYNFSVAPDDAFDCLSFDNKTGFEISDRLEAIDRQHPELTCVATIADVMDDYVLVHFDGWNSCYDYWCLTSSNHIRPIGWCEKNGKDLSPPLGFSESEAFKWSSYLEKNTFNSADSSLFNDEVHGFEVGMKLEVVDSRNPILIRAATIVDADEYRVQLHLDGWSEMYDFWLDADSRDLHPINWCYETGHALQPPINWDGSMSVDQCGCPVPGCNGAGHVKHDKYVSHHSEFGCPYSTQNLNREQLPDRLTYDRTNSHDDVIVDGNNNMKTNATLVVRKKRGRPRIHPQDNPRDRKTSRDYSRIRSLQESSGQSRVHVRHRSSRSSNVNTYTPLYEAAFMTSLSERQQQRELSFGWDQHVMSLPGVKGKNASQVTSWSCDQVSSFVNELTGRNNCGEIFVTEEIDGEAFLMLTQSDISSVLKLKLGPSVKIYNAILRIKNADKLRT